jgi:hypothetical protein
MPSRRDERTGRGRNRSRIQNNLNSNREFETSNRYRDDHPTYHSDLNDDIWEPQDLHEDDFRGTARAEYNERRNIGRRRDSREGNIIQRAADRIRDVWEDLVNSNDRDDRDDRDYEDVSYRNRRGVYNENEDNYETANWRRRNYEDLTVNDTEQHYRDRVHRQPFYDDGRITSHYNNEITNRNENSRGRSRSPEWNSRNKRRGTTYNSSDNYHGRSQYEHEDYDFNPDRG